MKRIRKRATYANVMSTIAVFLVLGGATAFAALGKGTVGTKQLKTNSVTAAKLKNKAVTTAKIADHAVTGTQVNLGSLGQVPSAAFATTAGNATNAGHATTAGNATTADGPIAFAHVSSTGALLDGRGVNVTQSISTSYYCFSGLSFDPRGIQATADYWNGSPTFNTMVQAGLASSGGLGGTSCPAGTQAFVHGTNAGSDTPTTAGFYVVFFR